jgi:polyhydroxyalkanoate synthesis repressor PhaR
MARIIKRYSNRKLYDTREKHYITLENIEILIKQEEEVHIIDNDSGDDITASTLSQIIAEQARKNKAYAPSIFVDMIRKGGDTMYDYARKVWQILSDQANSQYTESKEMGDKLVLSDADWEALLRSLLSRWDLPTQADMQRLTTAVTRLEQSLQELEKKVRD